MMIIHSNDWVKFVTDTIITDDGYGMISIDYYPEHENVGFIHDFSVIPPARRKGLGETLLQAAIDRAKEKGCTEVQLNYGFQATPKWVCDWYLRNGFQEIAFGNFNSLMSKQI